LAQKTREVIHIDLSTDFSGLNSYFPRALETQYADIDLGHHLLRSGIIAFRNSLNKYRLENPSDTIWRHKFTEQILI